MAEALGWGVVAASSLVVGAALALWGRPWPEPMIGAVLSFGAGALISAVSFELAAEGVDIGGSDSVAIGLAAGALVFFTLDRWIDSMGGGESGGTSFALGACLDGVPEQLVLGIGLASGEGVSVALLLAIYVSNLPEGLGSAGDLRAEGRPRGWIMRLWITVAIVCALATPLGHALADVFSDELKGILNGFAAGGLLVLLVDTMIPEAREKTGLTAGLIATLGFALAAGLSSVS